MIKKRTVIVRKVLKMIGTMATLILTFLTALLFFSIKWMFATWNDLSMDELVYHLNTPLNGTNSDIIWNYLDECMAPAIVVFLTLVFVYLGVRGKKRYYIVMGVSLIASCAVIYTEIIKAMDTLGAENYIKSKGTESNFVEEYYVSPADVMLEFPEKKRNLIYIFLESMEITYADKENGGAFGENVIPELTELAQCNEDFSGENDELNGGYSLVGSTWTMGAMFAQTSGLPLSISIGGNDMDTQDSFFDGAITLGDILNQAGYSQMLMIGSDATFGGRRLYFTEHGNYSIYDYNYALENHQIPDDYRVFWGYEDQKLFEFAKEKLMEQSRQEVPFNFTLLTVDTHFEDGYVCEKCPNIYGDNQYANVMACSSAQVAEFVNWIQQQDFYENTTIVISGDHPTMDSNFCEEIDENYDRKVYTSYINSTVAPEMNIARTYTTFDNFPTTLAALGVKIEGDRLALGTNLFSSRPTLSEEIGLENENEELSKKSTFLEQLANINERSEALLKKYGTYPSAEVYVDEYDSNIGGFSVAISEIEGVEAVESVQASIKMEGEQVATSRIELELGEDGYFRGNINVSSIYGYQPGEYIINGYIIDTDGNEYMVGETIESIY